MVGVGETRSDNCCVTVAGDGLRSAIRWSTGIGEAFDVLCCLLFNRLVRLVDGLFLLLLDGDSGDEANGAAAAIDGTVCF